MKRVPLPLKGTETTRLQRRMSASKVPEFHRENRNENEKNNHNLITVNTKDTVMKTDTEGTYSLNGDGGTAI